MGKKPFVRLYDAVGVGVIVHFPSGVIYSNQAGGHSCLQPEIEGVYVPIINDVVDQEGMLNAYFTGHKWNGACSNGIDTADADFIDGVLNKSVFTSFIKVDRTKLAQSYEAWIFVKLSDQPDSPVTTYDSSTGEGKTYYNKTVHDSDYDISVTLYPLYGFGTTTGVLTWTNSD